MLVVLLVPSYAFASENQTTLTSEKQALLDQIPGATLNADGGVTIPLENNKPIIVDLGDGHKVEYVLTIPETRSTTKTISCFKTYWFLADNMTVTWKANCTWGSPARTVRINSLTDGYKGGFAEMQSHSTKIITAISPVGGKASGEGKGEIIFTGGPLGQISTRSYDVTLTVDSADSDTLYFTEN